MTTKTADDMVQSAIRLPRSLHQRLKKTGGERGMGEEIRRRLEASFDAEKAPAEAKTRELLDAISYCAERTADDYRSWWGDAFSFEILKECVNMLLMRDQPKGEAVPKPNPAGMHDIIYGPEYLPKPEELSRLYVSAWIKDRAKRADDEKRR